MKRNYPVIFAPVVIIALFFMYSLIYSFIQSLGLDPIIGESQLTFTYYVKLFNDPVLIKSLRFTLLLSFIITITAMVITLLLLFSFFVFVDTKAISWLFKGMQLPIYIPYLISSYMIFILFMDNGVFHRLFVSSDVTFSSLVNDNLGLGILIAYIWKVVPFYLMMSYPVLRRIYKHWNDLAYLFELSKIQFFQKIIVPLLVPSLLISFIIVLTYIFASFEIPYILGSINPKMFSVFVYDQYVHGDLADRPYLMAMNVFTVLISVVFSGVVYQIYKKWANKMQGWY